MEWTTDRPTATGIYWAYAGKRVEIVDVVEKYQSPFDEPKPIEFECWPMEEDRPFDLSIYTHWSTEPLEIPEPPGGPWSVMPPGWKAI